MTKQWYVINTFIWAGCSTVWFWIGYILHSPWSFIIAILCGAVSVANGYIASEE